MKITVTKNYRSTCTEKAFEVESMFNETNGRVRIHQHGGIDAVVMGSISVTDNETSLHIDQVISDDGIGICMM